MPNYLTMTPSQLFERYGIPYLSSSSNHPALSYSENQNLQSRYCTSRAVYAMNVYRLNRWYGTAKANYYAAIAARHKVLNVSHDYGRNKLVRGARNSNVSCGARGGEGGSVA